MLAKIALAAAMAALVCAASAQADSIDGKPTPGADRHVPASVRGSPSILFEDVGALGPVDSCMSDGGGSCGAQGRF
jgi:hypothetical protein